MILRRNNKAIMI